MTISWLAGNLISTILSVCYSFSILKVSLVWVNSQLGKKIVLGEQNLGKADAAEVLWSLAIPFWLLMTLTLFTDISRNVKLLETPVKLQPLKFQEDQRTTAFQRFFWLNSQSFLHMCAKRGLNLGLHYKTLFSFEELLICVLPKNQGDSDGMLLFPSVEGRLQG